VPGACIVLLWEEDFVESLESVVIIRSERAEEYSHEVVEELRHRIHDRDDGVVHTSAYHLHHLLQEGEESARYIRGGLRDGGDALIHELHRQIRR